MLTHQALLQLAREFIGSDTLLSCQPLSHGLSNDNYLLTCCSAQYLFKCYKGAWPAVALAAQQQLSKQGVCPPVVWQNKSAKQAAFGYFAGQITNNYTVTDLLLNKLVTLHAYPVRTRVLNIAQAIADYRHSAIYQEFNHTINETLAVIAKMPANIAFCHNDLVRENIIDSETSRFFIDFEYAQSNDVYFDLAALVVSFELSATAQAALLTNYSAATQADFFSSIEKLQKYQFIYLILCIAWYEQRGINHKAQPLRAQLISLVASFTRL